MPFWPGSQRDTLEPSPYETPPQTTDLTAHGGSCLADHRSSSITGGESVMSTRYSIVVVAGVAFALGGCAIPIPTSFQYPPPPPPAPPPPATVTVVQPPATTYSYGSSGASGDTEQSTNAFAISPGGMAWLSANWPTLYSAVAAGDSAAVSKAINDYGPDPAYQQQTISRFKAAYPSDASKLGL